MIAKEMLNYKICGNNCIANGVLAVVLAGLLCVCFTIRRAGF